MSLIHAGGGADRDVVGPTGSEEIGLRDHVVDGEGDTSSFNTTAA